MSTRLVVVCNLCDVEIKDNQTTITIAFSSRLTRINVCFGCMYLVVHDRVTPRQAGNYAKIMASFGNLLSKIKQLHFPGV